MLALQQYRVLPWGSHEQLVTSGSGGVEGWEVGLASSEGYTSTHGPALIIGLFYFPGEH